MNSFICFNELSMLEKKCPSQNNLQDFLADKMLEKERDKIESHLADCADCRRNLALMFSEKNTEREVFETPKSLIETVKNLPNRQAKANSASFFSFAWLKINRLQVAFSMVVILSFGFLGFYVLQNRQISNSEDVLRNDTSNKNSLKLFAPENEANLSADKIEFRWSEMPNAKKYTLVLSDEKGDIIKELSTEKTQIETTISDLGMVKENRYFWHIKAKLTNGLFSESETRKIFVVNK